MDLCYSGSWPKIEFLVWPWIWLITMDLPGIHGTMADPGFFHWILSWPCLMTFIPGLTLILPCDYGFTQWSVFLTVLLPITTYNYHSHLTLSAPWHIAFHASSAFVFAKPSFCIHTPSHFLPLFALQASSLSFQPILSPADGLLPSCCLFSAV